MKIVQILPELNEGGVERGVVDISRALMRDNHESFIIARGGKLADTLEKDGAKFIPFDVKSKNIFTAFSRARGLKKILTQIAPDIVHVRSRVPAWLVKFAKNGQNFKVVSTVHGLNSVNLYSKIMTDADKIICVSNFAKDYVVDNFKADESKIKVIFRGVDLSDFDSKNYPSKKDLRDEMGLGNEFVLCVLGRITELKNIETAIKAVQILKANIPNIRLLVVGGASAKKQNYLKSLQEFALGLGLGENVRFVGSTSEPAKFYKLSDVVISASFRESFGRSVAEALALDTPVVASRSGGAVDIVIEGENGFLFEPKNPQELADKIIQAKGLKFDGFGYVSNKFSFENMYNQTLEIYKNLGEK